MDLTKGDLAKHIRRIAIPASIGFFFNTMYNVVDTFYAGQVSTDALAALSISFPIFFIILALGSGISQGATTLISNALGEGQKKKAQSYIHQGMSFSLITAIVLTTFGLLLAPYAFQILGAEGQYLDMALEYMNTILFGGLFFLMVQMGMAPQLAVGNTKVFRNMLIAGFFLNLVLDPWFMYGGFGLPAMGIRGIALATVVIQILGTLYAYFYLARSDLWTKLNWRSLIPKKRVFKEIAEQGFPSSLNMMSVAVGVFLITFFVSQYGSDAVAAFGIATRVEQIAVLPVIGLNMALVSVVGQNNGAKKFDRIEQSRYIALRYGFILAVVGGIFAFGTARPLMEMFADKANVVEIGMSYLKIIAPTFFGFMVFSQNAAMLRGLKRPFIAMWTTLVRQVLFPMIILSIVVFGFDLGTVGIWWGLHVNIWLVALLAFLLGTLVLKKREATAE
ncbi:MAG: MATE family efflux transporter [Nanoarchaeota archaeon]